MKKKLTTESENLVESIFNRFNELGKELRDTSEEFFPMGMTNLAVALKEMFEKVHFFEEHPRAKYVARVYLQAYVDEHMLQLDVFPHGPRGQEVRFRLFEPGFPGHQKIVYSSEIILQFG